MKILICLLAICIFFKLCIYYLYFLAELGLCCCAGAFPSYSEQGLFFVAVHRLIAVLLLLWSMGFGHLGFSSCGAQAWMPHGMWNLPGPGIEPVSLAFAGGFLSTVPPGKSSLHFLTNARLQPTQKKDTHLFIHTHVCLFLYV